MEGVVKWYNKEKGFGFIGTDDTDYFVHHSFVDDQVLARIKAKYVDTTQYYAQYYNEPNAFN